MKRHICTIFLLCCACLLGAQVPTSGLVARYNLDGDATDASGNGYDGTLVGGSFATDRHGNPGAALRLRPGLDSLTLTPGNLFPLSGDFTITFWIRANSVDPQHVFHLATGPLDTLDNFDWYLGHQSQLNPVAQNSSGTFAYWNGSGEADHVIREGMVMEHIDGRWHHLALRRLGDHVELWSIRAMLATDSFPGTIAQALPLVLGAAPWGLDAEIDDLLFYDRALTEHEIVAMSDDYRPYSFRYPQPTDAYFQGDTMLVWWVADTALVSDSVDLDFTTDGGVTWQPTAHPQTVDWTPWRVPMTWAPGTEVEFRVRDHLNPSLEGRTGAILVSEYRWEQVVDTLDWTNRDGVGLLEFQGELWALGGWDPPFHAPSATHSEIYHSSDAIHWTREADAPWPGRHDSGWHIHNGEFWLVGGDYQTGGLSDVWRSPDGINWDTVRSSIPGVSPVRYAAITASHQGYLYYMSGQTFIDQRSNSQQAWRSDDGLNWTQLPDVPWVGRGLVHLVHGPGDSLWLFGGGRELDRRAFNDVWVTADGVTWTQVVENAPWFPRYWHNTAYFDGKFWLTAGIASQPDMNETWFSADGIHWRQLQNSPWAGRHAASAAPFGDALYLMCGINTNDVWRLRNTLQPLAVTEAEAQAATQPLWFPNPAHDRIRCSATFQRAEVIDAQGRLVLTSGAAQGIDIGHLPAGVYIVRTMNMSGHVSHQKLIRQ